jgi:PilZ domain-containing protein
MTQFIEKRKSPRLSKAEPVSITVREGHTVMGTVENISQGGILVSIAEELELGVTYGIELTDSEGVLPLLGEALRLHMPPSHASPDEPRMFKVAFEFAGVGDTAARRLARLVDDRSGNGD